jgi:hypothetical protein
MRLRPAVLFSALALALTAGAAPALAAGGGSSDLTVQPVIPPSCPVGQRAVWVDRAGTLPKLYIDPFTGRLMWTPGEPEFHGWECQPIKLVPVA